MFTVGKRFISEPDYRFLLLDRHGLFDNWNDVKYLRRKYKALMGKELNIKKPITFNEKLQWLKLYDHNPKYTTMVDKYRVKKYIENKIGAEYVIPTLGVWDNFDDIDVDNLPNQFVLKCTHDSGGLVICKNKKNLDVASARKKINKSLKTNFFLRGREWPYKDVPRKIIAERFMDDGTGEELRDYKVLCFDGEPKLIEIHEGRFSGHHTQDFYDVNCNLTKYEQPDDPLSGHKMEKPVLWDKMMDLSRELAEGIPHIRVDWYIIDERLYFGELTFFDGSGFSAFIGDQDKEIGSWITLPRKENC